MNEHTDVTSSVVGMYLDHPFPKWTAEERRRRLPNELVRYRYLGLEEAMRNARFLDVGCGTGNRSMLAAKHFDVNEYIGLDATKASLELAEAVAAEEGVQQFQPVHANLFDIPFPDGSFDVVVSWGVLHHTPDPFRGLREMVRVCRPGGYVGVFLYNKWNHWRHNLQKNKVDQLAGDNVEERFRIAHQLYGTKSVTEMTPEEIAVFFDKYCHPHKSDHTLGETLEWFSNLGLEYWGSYPPLTITEAIGALQFRRKLSGNRGDGIKFSKLMKVVGTVPIQLGRTSPPFEAPRLVHRFIWQFLYAWLGRHGEYSGGAALAARKPVYA